MERLQSLLGVFVLVGIAWALSSNRRGVAWRCVLGGIVLQFVMGGLLLGFSHGRESLGFRVFGFVNESVAQFLSYSRAGAVFVFGPLGIPPGETGPGGEPSPGFILAFQAFPTIIFFSALMGALYFIGLMPRVLRVFSALFARSMRLSGAESLCAASNIFVGIESLFSVRPHLGRMTASEYHLVLTAQMATIASSVLGLYVMTLQSQFPMIAGHLVSASLLSAPAAIVMAKLLLPESGVPATLGVTVGQERGEAKSLIESILLGANEGLKLAFGIAALLIALLGMVALLNGGLGWAGGLAGVPGFSIQKALGWLFYPFALLIGVAPVDAPAVAGLLGERTVLTEVVAYMHLSELIGAGGLVEPRSAVLASYALCGFSHVASMAIFVGGLAALVPERAGEIARLGPRALVAATLACLQTAAVAGVFLSQSGGYLFAG